MKVGDMNMSIMNTPSIIKADRGATINQSQLSKIKSKIPTAPQEPNKVFD